MQVQPYLFFNGRCEEAVEFYRRALGAEVSALMRFKDGPAPDHGGCPGGAEISSAGTSAGGTPPHPAGEQIMYAAFRIGETTVMASDGRPSGQASFAGFALTITAPDAAEAERLFGLLADGGQVQAPLAETFFSPRFGMVADRFGVPWMIVV